MQVTELAPGLWRWDAPHPAWRPEDGRPDGWDRMVASYYYEHADSDRLVLFDPQLPPPGSVESDEFFAGLDSDVERTERIVSILVGNAFHARSAAEIAERYTQRHGAEIWVHARAVDRTSCTPSHPFIPGEDAMPAGVAAFGLADLDGPEVAFHLPEHRALVFSDALLGAGEGLVRVPPQSWAADDELSRARYASFYRQSFAPLLELDVDMLLVTHGEPIVREGAGALAEALAARAWGEPAGLPD